MTESEASSESEEEELDKADFVGVGFNVSLYTFINFLLHWSIKKSAITRCGLLRFYDPLTRES